MAGPRECDPAVDNPSVPNVYGAPEPPAEPRNEVADRDLRIERPDLGPNSYTPIRAGEPIPAALADLPRRDDAPPGKPSRRKPPE